MVRNVNGKVLAQRQSIKSRNFSFRITFCEDDSFIVVNESLNVYEPECLELSLSFSLEIHTLLIQRHLKQTSMDLCILNDRSLNGTKNKKSMLVGFCARYFIELENRRKEINDIFKNYGPKNDGSQKFNFFVIRICPFLTIV